MEERLLRYNVAEDIPEDFFRELKESGYSDAQIAWLLRIKEEEVFRRRIELGIRRTFQNGGHLRRRI
jgi:carbamoyl-phosphate synthase large subunit